MHTHVHPNQPNHLHEHRLDLPLKPLLALLLRAEVGHLLLLLLPQQALYLAVVPAQQLLALRLEGRLQRVHVALGRVFGRVLAYCYVLVYIQRVTVQSTNRSPSPGGCIPHSTDAPMH